MSLSFTALSQKDIDFTLGYQGVSGTYSDDTLKKSISSNGFIINTTFLDDLTITHTSTKTAITNTVPANNIDQTSLNVASSVIARLINNTPTTQSRPNCPMCRQKNYYHQTHQRLSLIS